MAYGPKPWGLPKMIVMAVGGLLPPRIRKWLGFPVGISFLKCDRLGCVHIEFHDDIVAEQVGKPCPLCRSSLMSQAEFDAWPPSSQGPA